MIFINTYMKNIFFFFTENNVTLRKYIIPMFVVVIFSIVIIAFYLHTKLNGKQKYITFYITSHLLQ